MTLRLGQDQVLDDVDVIAQVEHAMCVEYLTVYCALGRGLVPDELPPGGRPPSADVVRQAAETAFGLALGEMNHLRKVNAALVLGGRPPQLRRAAVVPQETGTPLTLGTPDADELASLHAREAAIAAAVDAMYARLRLTVEGADPPLQGDLLDQVTFVLDTCADHAGGPPHLRARLDGLGPTEFLLATRRQPADDLERTLQALSDEHYALVVQMLTASFEYDDQLGGRLRNRALSLMDGLNEVNALLVARGLLPAFTTVI